MSGAIWGRGEGGEGEGKERRQKKGIMPTTLTTCRNKRLAMLEIHI